jgi:hypothetical protein
MPDRHVLEPPFTASCSFAGLEHQFGGLASVRDDVRLKEAAAATPGSPAAGTPTRPPS